MRKVVLSAVVAFAGLASIAPSAAQAAEWAHCRERGPHVVVGCHPDRGHVILRHCQVRHCR